MNPIDVNAIQEREIVPGYRARFVHSEHMTLAFWNVAAGSPLPEHAHPHEQITRVLQGRFQLTVGGETHTLGPGMAMVIPGGVRHSAVALTACRLMDVFHPAREEYR